MPSPQQLWLRTGLIIVASCLFRQSLMGTLIIGVYNHDALYVGSDSLVRNFRTGDPVLSEKTFPFSRTACASIVNNYGGSIRETNTGRRSFLFFSTALRQICSNAFALHQSPEDTMTFVTSVFNRKYFQFMENRVERHTPELENTTRICFWSYNEARKMFGCYSYVLDTKTSTELEVEFQRGATNTGPPLILVGEGTFLPQLIRSTNAPLIRLRSDAFENTVKTIMAEDPIRERDMVWCILEMFRLQRAYAARFSKDKGWIDAPYVIYKITKNGTARIH
jgi:hypothetical protein